MQVSTKRLQIFQVPEVSKYEVTTDLAIWDTDSGLDMDDIICDVKNL